MKLQVECYSGRKADERPVRFQLSERGCLVEEVLDQWYGQDATSSKCARMMAICSYFGTTYPTRSGVWKRFASSRNSLCLASFCRETLEVGVFRAVRMRTEALD